MSDPLPYIPLEVFTSTKPTGGDSTQENLNRFYEVSLCLSFVSQCFPLSSSLILLLVDRERDMDSHIHRAGFLHDTWSRVFLLWTGAEEVSLIAHLVDDDVNCGRQFPGTST